MRRAALVALFSAYRVVCVVLTGSPEAFCSRAWREWPHSRRSRIFVALMGIRHCANSAAYWRDHR